MIFFKYSYKVLLSTKLLSANKDTQDIREDEASVSGQSSKTVTSGQHTSEGMITFY